MDIFSRLFRAWGSWGATEEPVPFMGVCPVDKRDSKTPDNWVPRDASLIRLTGNHPFNAEPPASLLVKSGFLTPTRLHYVRNHGAVPRLDWGSHTISLQREGREVLKLSMRELASMQCKTLTVTLTCAGNRRKEQNMVRKSMGFDWGAGAVSTSEWTGTLLSDLLFSTGLVTDSDLDEGQKYICFQGADSLPKGIYGTSITLETALDPSREVLVAFKQGGEYLAPDHGFPVRMIVPGYIGGRMVKWLKVINVSDRESQDYYHFYDNRVLPPSLDELALERAPHWWRLPEYLINDRNLNSVITYPSEDAVVVIGKATALVEVTGYAYNGSGRSVTRVEVTLDNGKSWLLAKIHREEKKTRYGRSWCWVRWEVEIPATELLTAGTLAVRAWDDSMNTQPRFLTWNVLGMMNNPWYVVRPVAEWVGQGLGLRLRHPALVKDLGKGGNLGPRSAKSYGSLSQKPKRVVSRQELAKHAASESCWIGIHGTAYDCTRWLKRHPGGAASILDGAGTDVTAAFDAIHSEKAQRMLNKWAVGAIEL